jgi:RNA polymerase sigma factor (sigma-70 family)
VHTFDAQLSAAQVGAPWACAALWRDYAPAVAAFLRARGSRDPDDLTSEVFLAVFDQLARFTGGEPEFRSFVFSIAYRRLTDELRRRSRRGDTAEWSPQNDPRRAPSAEEVAHARQGDASALDLLDGLPEDQRNVMVLRIVADLTVEQVADALGKRPGAVKALQRRALESLRKNLSPTRTLSGLSNDSYQ